MAIKHISKYSAFLTIQEIQISRVHLTLVRMAIIKNTMNADVEQGELSKFIRMLIDKVRLLWKGVQSFLKHTKRIIWLYFLELTKEL